MLLLRCASCIVLQVFNLSAKRKICFLVAGKYMVTLGVFLLEVILFFGTRKTG